MVDYSKWKDIEVSDIFCESIYLCYALRRLL